MRNLVASANLPVKVKNINATRKFDDERSTNSTIKEYRPFLNLKETRPNNKDGLLNHKMEHHTYYLESVSDSKHTHDTKAQTMPVPSSRSSSIISGVWIEPESSSSGSSLESLTNLHAVTFYGDDSAHLAFELDRSNALFAAFDETVDDKVIWIGCIPSEGAKLTEEHKKTLRTMYNSVCIEIRPHEGRFSRYCRRILEPIFHNMLPDYHLSQYNSSDWDSYVKYNQAFADAIIKEYRDDDDMIWINDFQLLLLPQMIRNCLKHARIGFYLHAPFPTSEIFRCLPSKVMILEGMLAADLVGFQTYNFARHFIHSCTRILGLESSLRGFQVDGDRTVNIVVCPIGINPELFQSQLQVPETQASLAMLRDRYAGTKLILSIDPSGVLSGVQQKLLAFDALLRDHPEWVGKLILVQVFEKTGEKDKYYASLVNFASAINQRHGSLKFTPIVISSDSSQNHVNALLQLADICLITTLCDGMSLTAHKFVLAQESLGNNGSVIMSEFSGAALTLNGVMRINPWDNLKVKNALLKAIGLDKEEKRARHMSLLRQIFSLTANNWARNFYNELLKSTDLTRQIQLMITPPLDRFKLKSSLKFAQKALFVIDYDALVPSFRTISSSFTSVNRLRHALAHLVNNGQRTLILLSNRTADQLEHTLGSIPLVMCAEDGFTYRTPSGKWNDLFEIPEFWPKLSHILDYWTERTPGAWLETKRASYIWHYSTAGKIGMRQAKECHAHIQDALGSSYSVHVVVGREKLQIKLRPLNQQQALRSMLKIHFDESFDFIGIFLRPTGMEDVFKDCMETVSGVKRDFGPKRAEYFVTVGRSNSLTVPWHIPDSQSLIHFIESL